MTDCHHTGGVSYGAFRYDRHNSRRDYLSGTDLAIAARHAPLAELRADPAARRFLHHNVGVLAMSRTPLFAAIKKALARSAHEHGFVLPQSSALTRRRLLRLSAAAAGATALSPVFEWSAYAKEEAPALDRHHRRRRCRTDRGLSSAGRRRERRLCSKRAIVGADACSPNTISTRACSASSAASSWTPIMRICRSSPANVGVEMQKLDHRRRWRGLYFFDGSIPHAEGHDRPGKADGRLCADRQADRRRRRQAHRQRRQLDGSCPQARSRRA